MTQPSKSPIFSRLKLILISSLVVILIIAAKQFNLYELLQTSLTWVKSLGFLGAIAFITIYNRHLRNKNFLVKLSSLMNFANLK
jgi:hypothetical protein